MRDPAATVPTQASPLHEAPSVRVDVADLADATRAAQVLMRAGFHVAEDTSEGARGAEEVGCGGPTDDRSGLRLEISDVVARADLAVRVTRAAECLDDPCTALMANLDTLEGDLLDGSVDAEDALETVGDCVAAVHQLLEGIQRIKAVAAPPVWDPSGEASLDLVLRDAAHRHRRRSSVPVELPRVQGLRVRGGRLALGQAVADVLEVFGARERPADASAVRVTTARDGIGVRVFVYDDGPPLPPDLRRLLTGGTRARSLDELALLAAATLVEGVGGALRVAGLPGQACLELRLPLVDAQD